MNVLQSKTKVPKKFQQSCQVPKQIQKKCQVPKKFPKSCQVANPKKTSLAGVLAELSLRVMAVTRVFGELSLGVISGVALSLDIDLLSNFSHRVYIYSYGARGPVPSP